MPLTEAEIFEEVIAPDQGGLSPEAARVLLRLGFKDSAKARISELLRQNNGGDLSAGDRAELEKYLQVGQFLDLLQAKARLSLRPVAKR
jgi:hypothetical protein